MFLVQATYVKHLSNEIVIEIIHRLLIEVITHFGS
jgi:hypothetical protein